MKNTKTVAVPTVLTDAKTIEPIAYNIAATAQIQPSMSEPADRLEAIIHNIAATAQIQPSSMSEFADGADPAPSAARRPGPSSPSVRGRVRRCKLG